MKKYIILLIVCICLFSCEKYFHEEATFLGKIETLEALEDATQGVYAKLAEALSTDNGINVIMSPNIKGDDINLGSENYQEYYDNTPRCWELNDQNLENYFSSQDYSWIVLYEVIVSANNILKQFNISETENTEICHLLGEVIFLRAYCFFRLTRTYGQIPIITDTEISYHAKLADFETIYSFLEQELRQSSKLLPENTDEARIPYITVHKGVALAFLAEVYLHWAGYPLKENEKYRLAAQTASGIIDSADYYGFQLQEDFANVWDNNIHLNPESVFSIYFENAENATNRKEAGLVDYTGYSFINPTGFSSEKTKNIELLFFPSEIQFFNQYPRSYRKDITFFKDIYSPDQSDTAHMEINEVGPCSRIAYRKFIYNELALSPEQFNINFPIVNFLFGLNKVYIYRYAHTLLTYAEASARAGELNEKSYECVNMIRRRAHNVNLYSSSRFDLQPGLSTDVFADSVLWERAWEFAGEPEGRWFDLVRLEMVEDLPELRDPEEGGPPYSPFTKEDYFLRIPGEDQLLNPNLGE